MSPSFRPDRTSTWSAVSSPSGDLAHFQPVVRRHHHHLPDWHRPPSPGSPARDCAATASRSTSAYIPGISSRVGFGTSTSVSMVRVASDELVGETRHLSGNVRFSVGTLHLHLLADMHRGHRRFGHRKNQPQQLFSESLHHRHRLRLRGRARLDHGAGIGVALGDHAGEGAVTVRASLRFEMLTCCSAAARGFRGAICASATRSPSHRQSPAAPPGRAGFSAPADKRWKERCAIWLARSARCSSSLARATSALLRSYGVGAAQIVGHLRNFQTTHHGVAPAARRYASTGFP